jgi:uncharacterized membrane protein
MLLVSIIIIAVIALAVDSVYLYTMGDSFKRVIETVQGSVMRVNIVGATLVYVFIGISLLYFVISKRGSPFDAFVLGITSYGIYDFTNVSLISKWPIYIATIDTLWGGILYYLTTSIIYKFKLI